MAVPGSVRPSRNSASGDVITVPCADASEPAPAIEMEITAKAAPKTSRLPMDAASFTALRLP